MDVFVHVLDLVFGRHALASHIHQRHVLFVYLRQLLLQPANPTCEYFTVLQIVLLMKLWKVANVVDAPPRIQFPVEALIDEGEAEDAFEISSVLR